MNKSADIVSQMHHTTIFNILWQHTISQVYYGIYLLRGEMMQNVGYCVCINILLLLFRHLTFYTDMTQKYMCE